MTVFNEGQHPRSTNGEFTAKSYAEADASLVPAMKLTEVKPGKYDHYPLVEGRVQVGPAVTVGTGIHSKKPLKQRDVYLDGERIGTARQREERGEKKIRGSRLVSVTGYPVVWHFNGADASARFNDTQLGRTVLRAAEDIVKRRASRDAAERAEMLTKVTAEELRTGDRILETTRAMEFEVTKVSEDGYGGFNIDGVVVASALGRKPEYEMRVYVGDTDIPLVARAG